MRRTFLILSLWLFLFHPVALFPEEKSVEFLIDDFEARKWQNLLGGQCGSWEKDPFAPSEFCRASFSEDERANKKTTALRLQYGVTPYSYNGYFTNLYGMDIRPYKYLTFWVKKSRKYFPDSFKIELKTTKRIASYRYKFKNNNVEWLRVEIPLKDFINFGELQEWKRTKELTIVFGGTQMTPPVGVVYLDDIGFSSPSQYYKNRTKYIAKETAKIKEETRRMAALPEDQLLELISRKTFDYFWYESSAATGLVKDRSVRFGAASLGATGFGLTAACIGIERKWITRRQGYNRVLKILKALKDKSAKKHGFFYHWVNPHTGRRDGRSEVSSVDTALLLGGVLTVRQYFPQKEIKALADEIYRNVQWSWMMGNDPSTGLVYMGWAPEEGFKGFILWDMFAEEMMMYLLGIGSPTYPLPEKSWDSFARPVKKYADQTYIYHDGETMFVYLYSHCWVDFRNRHDMYADYFRNSQAAIKSNYQFCVETKDKFKTYREGYWGISASDGPRGYAAFGALFGMHEGTIPPYSLCGALPFTPELAMPAIRSLLANYGDRVWGRYGFVSAFNLDRDWFSNEYIGIDQGTILLMIENYRSGFVWKTFMSNPYIKAGMKRAKFKAGTKELDVAFLEELQRKREEAGLGSGYKKLDIKRAKAGMKIDADLSEWTELTRYDLEKDKEYGEILSPEDFSAAFGFRWDEDNLYFLCDITDDEIVAREAKNEIYRGDCIELYLDFKTRGRNFIWGDKENFQIGFAADSKDKQPAAWSWFQDLDPKDEIKMAAKKKDGGYIIEAAISWKLLKQQPKPGLSFGCSVAIHDLDSKMRGADKKLNWCFKKVAGKIGLGEVTLCE